MRLLVLLGLIGCAKAPPSPAVSAPTPPAVSPSTPPACLLPGTWRLTAEASCAAKPEQLVLAVHAGPNDARDPTPLFEVPSVIAAGRTNDGYGYDRLLRVTSARATALGCEMDLHVEYVGPHEAIEYRASATIAGDRVRGTGCFTLLLEDCEPSAERECTCESALAIDGIVH